MSESPKHDQPRVKRIAEDTGLDVANQIDQICDEFERDRSSDDPQSIEAYLERVPQDQRDRLLRELLLVEWDSIDRKGDRRTIDQYINRFSDCTQLIQEIWVDCADGGARSHDSAQDSLRATKSDPPGQQKKSKQIGPYKLLQQIGEGGMGTVWMAEQEKPVRRRVAVKLIRDDMGSKETIARFEAERQALAMMDHNNIARVLDAGTTDSGSPYFVMELVKGIPITEYCDSNRLPISERLELLVPVCKAVQHAHQKGIIHRDLKPSNVLVTLRDGLPVPKVIDFGLAKALEQQMKLTDKTMFTQFGQVVGTLRYMSPEQAEMNDLDVDTRTDIYSLGVMLYELLTGSTPLDKETLGQQGLLNVLEMIREKEPPRPSHRLSSSGDAITGISEQRKIAPSKLQQILRGELDWVVMKALEKDRTRRYDTANSLADDIQNYLDGNAVKARPPTAGYRLMKVVQKHKTAVASAAVSVLSLLALIVALGMMWFQADRDSRISEHRRVFDTELMRISQPPGSLNIEDVEPLLETADLAATLDRDLAQSMRNRVLEALCDSIEHRISAQRIDAQQLQQIEDSIAKTDSLAQRYPELAPDGRIAELRSAITRRVRDWHTLIAIDTPLESEDLDLFLGGGIAGREDRLFIDGQARAVLIDRPLPSNVNTELTAVFDRRLSSTSWVGLSLNETQDGGVYRFYVSSVPLLESELVLSPAKDDRERIEPRFSGEFDVAPSLQDSITRRRPVHLSITRSGRVLAQRTALVPSSSIRLTARRERESLTFVLNGNEALKFEDAFSSPPDQNSRLAILWPEQVGVSQMQILTRSIASTGASDLELGDSLYAQRDYHQAALAYGQVDSIEAQYKRAACWIRVERIGDAREQFERIANIAPDEDKDGLPTQPWQLLSNVQLLEQFRDDSVQFQRVLDRITSAYGHRIEYVLRVAPVSLHQSLLSFLQKDGARWKIYIRPRGDINELELALRLQCANGSSRERIRATRWRLSDAFRVAGDRGRSRKILDELIDEVALENRASREFALLVNDRCWLDFVDGNPESAEQRVLDVIGNGDGLPSVHAILLVDLARARIVQNDLSGAEGWIQRYVETVPDSEPVPHGEFAEACLIAGLIKKRQGSESAAAEYWRKGLLKNWRLRDGQKAHVEPEENAFTWGVDLIERQKSNHFHSLLQSLTRDISVADTFRAIDLDLPDDAIGSRLLKGRTTPFLAGLFLRPILGGMFDVPDGDNKRDQLILHQREIRDTMLLPLEGMCTQLILNSVYLGDSISEDLKREIFDNCCELIRAYDEERIDITPHFTMLLDAYLGSLSVQGWEELQRVLPSELASGVALVAAKAILGAAPNSNVAAECALPFLDFVLENPDSPPAISAFAAELKSGDQRDDAAN